MNTAPTNTTDRTCADCAVGCVDRINWANCTHGTGSWDAYIFGVCKEQFATGRWRRPAPVEPASRPR